MFPLLKSVTEMQGLRGQEDSATELNASGQSQDSNEALSGVWEHVP